MKSRINFFLIIAIILMLIQISLGISVREFIDNQIDILGFEKKDFWLNKPELNFYIHRTFSLLVFLSNFYLFLLAKKSKIDFPHSHRLNRSGALARMAATSSSIKNRAMRVLLIMSQM